MKEPGNHGCPRTGKVIEDFVLAQGGLPSQG